MGNHGYGCLRVNYRTVTTHTFAWELANKKPVPRGLCVMHTCDVRRCCEPNHLKLGTRTENHQDMVAKGRQRGPRGEQHPNYKLSDEVIALIRMDCSTAPSIRSVARKWNITHSYTLRLFHRTTNR